MQTLANNETITQSRLCKELSWTSSLVEAEEDLGPLDQFEVPRNTLNPTRKAVLVCG